MGVNAGYYGGMNTTTATTVRIEFESTTCDRCGGTGQMPFAVYGGACFKCHRRGTVDTRKGRAARDRMAEWQAANMTVTVADVAPGDRVYRTDIQGRRYVATVVEVGPSASRQWTTDPATGEQVEVPLTNVTTNRGGGLIAPADHTLTRAWTADTIRRCYAEALTRMSGATLVE